MTDIIDKDDAKPKSVPSFRPSYMNKDKDKDKDKEKDTSLRPIQGSQSSKTPKISNEDKSPPTSPSSTSPVGSYSFSSTIGPPNVFDERPTDLDQHIYTKAFMLTLRPPPAVVPQEIDVIESMKSQEVWVDNYTDSSKSDSGRQKTRQPSRSARPPKYGEGGRKSQTQRDENEQFRASLQSLLNKLTIDKFDILTNKLLELLNKIEDVEVMKDAVNIIHKKALTEPNFSTMYADMCRILSKECKTFAIPSTDKVISFRQLILNKCQEVFEASMVPLTPEDEPDDELRGKLNREAMGNVVFLGELFKKTLTPPKIISECLQLLLHKMTETVKLRDPKGQAQAEICCEKLCKLFVTVGKTIIETHPKLKSTVDKIFKETENFMQEEDLAPRFRFMIRDIIETKNNNWTPRRIVEGPKTIEAIHNDAGIPHDPPPPSTVKPKEKSRETIEEPNTVTSPTKCVLPSATRTIVSRRIIEIPKAKELPPEPIDIEKLELLFEELFITEDIDEAVAYFSDLVPSYDHIGPRTVVTGINISVEKGQPQRQLVAQFLEECHRRELLSTEQYHNGLCEILAIISDLVLDVPVIHSFLAYFIFNAIRANCIRPDFVEAVVVKTLDASHVDKLKTHLQIMEKNAVK